MLNKQIMISIEDALPGREASIQIDDTHFVNQSSLTAQPQAHQQQIVLGMGCFWGAERLFWQIEGVVSTSVGYAGGYTCLLYTSPSPRDRFLSRMPSSA